MMSTGHDKSLLPARWTAPESALHGEFSTASDMWMFGVLAHEVLTHGMLPYAHESDTRECLKKVRYFGVAQNIFLLRHTS